MVIYCAVVDADAESPRFRFEIPRGSAGTTLNLLAQQARAPLMFPFDRVRGIVTNPVEGDYTLSQALTILLARTPLQGALNEQGVLVITVTYADNQDAEIEDDSVGDKQMKGKKRGLLAGLIALLTSGGSATSLAEATHEAPALEEVIVTAQKREQSLEDVPIAINALGAEELAQRGITSLEGFVSGASPFVQVQPFASQPSSLNVSVRGVATIGGQTSRDPTVSVYVNDVFLGPIQGLSMELVDLERVEILRGPQGTLFGRNSVGGALHLITKKPTGEFGFRQELTAGNYGYVKAHTTVNTPKVNGLSLKLDYLYSDRDGWVKNLAADQPDLAAVKNKGGRVEALWEPTGTFSVNYAFDISEQKTTSNYFQIQAPNISGQPVEPDRVKRTQLELLVEPGDLDVEGHALTMTWDITSDLTLKSITSYRELDYFSFGAYGAAIFYIPANGLTGLLALGNADQEQFSQEIQLVGRTERLEYAMGLFYFDQEIIEDIDSGASIILSPAGPVYLFDNPIFFTAMPSTRARSDTKSQAVYGQVTWTPAVLADRLHLTLGSRYTDDDKKHKRLYFQGQPENPPPKVDASSDELDWAASVSYDWTDSISTYFRYATGYRSGGLNLRDANMLVFKPDKTESFELGLKSTWWERRARLNAAVYTMDWTDKQLDFANPLNPSITSTVNAGKADIDGVELEFSVLPTESLTLSLSYAYMDTKLPPQPNPFLAGALDDFALPQSPEHSAVLAIDYESRPLPFGVVTAHFDVSSSSKFATTANDSYNDSYTIMNARLTLQEISVGEGKGEFKLSLWGKNINDEEYEVYGFDVIGGNTRAYGLPRTYGVDIVYEY